MDEGIEKEGRLVFLKGFKKPGRLSEINKTYRMGLNPSCITTRSGLMISLAVNIYSIFRIQIGNYFEKRL